MSVPGDVSALEEARRAENEVTFREANESIRTVVADAPGPLPVVPFVCECGDETCRVLVRVRPGDYAVARESPRRFLVAPGHEGASDSPSTVVRTSAEFVIIEKGGLAGEVAEARAREGAAGG